MKFIETFKMNMSLKIFCPGLMQEALMANPYETLNVATALDRALKVSLKTLI